MNGAKTRALWGVIVLAGCASQPSVPLPDSDGLIANPDELVQTLPDSARVDLHNGVGIDEIASIAVITNPDLLAVRARLNVAQAQLFAAKLLPDPQLDLALEHPTSNEPGLVNARTATLNYDLRALLNLASGIKEQRAASDQVRLDVVWQEWQVAQQARLLFVRERTETSKLALLKSTVESFEQRQSMSATALAEGNVTVAQAGPDLTALLDISSQANQLQQQNNQTQHELRALLGLVPDSPLELSDLPQANATQPVDVTAMMPLLMRRRPDLLALQAGYTSQEARVRKAVLSFFPALVVGLTRALDTGGIRTSGVGVSLGLPFFSGNRGDVRIERATREQLRTEYRARLAQTRSDISRLARERVVLDAHREFLRKHIPELERMARQAEAAYATRNVDALVYLNIENALINKRMELIDLEQSMWEIAIALETITAQVPAP